MMQRKKLLLNTNLYLIVSITDCKNFSIFYRRAEKALRAGIRILQLRCKEIDDSTFLKFAQCFRRLTHQNKALFIINDRLDIACCCDADGVHLGQDDLPLTFARAILGKDRIIGESTHNLRQSLQAQLERADYIGFGPIFKTKTKPRLKEIGPEAISSLAKRIKIPVFVLGGIDEHNIKEIILKGAKRVAVSNAIITRKYTARSVKNLKKFLSNDPT